MLKIGLIRNSVYKYKKMLPIKRFTVKKEKTLDLPIVTTPLVVYNIVGTIRNALTAAKKKELDNLANDLQKGNINEAQYNTKVREVNNYYSNAINNCNGKTSSEKIIRQSPAHKGAPEDGIYDSILASDLELARDLRELQSIDTSLSPELQEYRDLPDFDNPRELLEYFIGDKLPDDVILDWDLWSVLETMWEELLDIGDWL